MDDDDGVILREDAPELRRGRRRERGWEREEGWGRRGGRLHVERGGVGAVKGQHWVGWDERRQGRKGGRRRQHPTPKGEVGQL